MHDLNMLLLNIMIYCMVGTLIALQNDTKENLQCMPIEIFPGRLPLYTRHRGDLPGLNTPYMHLVPLEIHWCYGIDKITLLGLKNYHLCTNFNT